MSERLIRTALIALLGIGILIAFIGSTIETFSS